MPTYEDIWRDVLLQAPDVPMMTARKFVRDVYLQLSGRRGWDYLRQEGTLLTKASRSVVVDVVLGSAAVASAALFLAADVGRQFRIGSGETFTVLSFTSTSAMTLDRPYSAVTAVGTTASILDAYVTVPADFARFDTILDLVQQRRLPWWTSQDELNGLDPMRLNSGAPRLLSAITPDPVTLRPRYEWWPRPTVAAAYPMIYFRRPATPADTDLLRGVLAERPDVLELGALARAAKYPGTADRPNAYFNLPLARELQAEFEAVALQVDLRDDDVAPQDYVPNELWTRAVGWEYSMNLHTLRQTDAGAWDGYF